MKRIILLFLALGAVIQVLSQEAKTITNVSGMAYITGQISEDAATRGALAQAKIEALRRAGVKEHITAYEAMYKGEQGDDYAEFFASDVQQEIRGAVQSYSNLRVKKGLDPQTSLLFVEVTIDAEVVTYQVGADPTFQVEVQGILPIYKNGESMQYQVMATQTCYITVFNLYNDHATLIYPNPWETHQLIPAGKSVFFPSETTSYEMVKTTKEPELNKFVFVFTKEPIPYRNFKLTVEQDQVTSFDDLMAWVYRISPDKRVVEYVAFSIR